MTHWHAYTDAPEPVWFTGGQAEVPAGLKAGRGEHATVVPMSFDAWRELKMAGHHAPHPLPFTYDWPGPWTPRDNQRRTAEFLATHARCVCLNGMRTGKTLSALWATDYLKREGVIGPVLIVCPRSTMEIVWERNILRTFGNRYAWKVLTGTRAQKQAEAARNRAFTIVNPESLHIIAKQIKPSLVIVDEATSMKNASSRRWKALKAIVGDDVPLWMLTATPTQQSPEDAHGLLLFLRSSYMSKQHWRSLTMMQVTKFKWVPLEDAEQTVARYLQPAIRFTLEDCGDVPTVTKEYLPVEQTPAQKKLCKALVEQAVADMESGEQITAVNAAAVLTKLLQVQGGGVYVDDDGERVVRSVAADPMYEAIEEYVSEADTPVVVFCPFRAVAKAVSEKLNAPLIWGDTHPDVRREICDDFQARRHHAIVAVPETMSHGLTLNAARYVLWVLPPFKSETYAQANGRVLEADSNKRIVITHLVPSQVAKDRYNALESKERLQDTVLNLLQGGM